MPRVAAVSLELPWSSDELELICGLSSSDSSGLACQPQSSLGTRSTGAAIVARAARPLTSARTRELARGAGPLRHRWCIPCPAQRDGGPSARTAGVYTEDVRPSFGSTRPWVLALRMQQFVATRAPETASFPRIAASGAQANASALDDTVNRVLRRRVGGSTSFERREGYVSREAHCKLLNAISIWTGPI